MLFRSKILAGITSDNRSDNIGCVVCVNFVKRSKVSLVMKKLQLFIKRVADILISSVMILVLIAIPVLIIIPIAIRLDSKGPAVFTQDRTGKDGKVFKIYKFRTMRIPEESFGAEGNPLTPKQRITKVGRILRKTSLDELMQLFNVLNGTMSFVGPRPMLPNQAAVLDAQQSQRHAMRPGVTGWAQVHGRNDLSWGQKIPYDLQYIENYSLWLDIKVLFKTVGVVLKTEGIDFKDGDTLLKQTEQKSEEEVSAK